MSDSSAYMISQHFIPPVLGGVWSVRVGLSRLLAVFALPVHGTVWGWSTRHGVRLSRQFVCAIITVIATFANYK